MCRHYWNQWINVDEVYRKETSFGNVQICQRQERTCGGCGKLQFRVARVRY